MKLSSAVRMPCLLAVSALFWLVAAQPASAQPGTIEGLGDKCLDVLQSGTADGTPLVLFRCTGTPNQTFAVEQVGNQVRVRTIGDKCVQPFFGGPTAPLSDAVIGPCENPGALWNISGWFPESFALRDAGVGLCLDVLGASTDDLTPIVLFGCTGNANQAWTFKAQMIGGPPVEQAGDLLGIGDNCLDVLGSGTTDGTPIVMFQCTGNANQEWTFDAIAASLRIRGLADKCLVSSPLPINPTSDFRQAVLGSCDRADAFWNLTANGPAPSFGLVNNASGQCLDVLGGGTDDLTPAGFFDCSGTANQSWRFEPRAAPDRCIPSSNRLCLNQDRFQAEVTWRNFAGETGTGRAQPLANDDSGLFWFFQANNLEMLVKVLDNCGGNTNRFWVFAAATTNVEYTLRVTDTETGAVRTYFNPLGTRSPAITDTDAFATCP